MLNRRDLPDFNLQTLRKWPMVLLSKHSYRFCQSLDPDTEITSPSGRLRYWSPLTEISDRYRFFHFFNTDYAWKAAFRSMVKIKR